MENLKYYKSTNSLHRALISLVQHTGDNSACMTCCAAMQCLILLCLWEHPVQTGDLPFAVGSCEVLPAHMIWNITTFQDPYTGYSSRVKGDLRQKFFWTGMLDWTPGSDWTQSNSELCMSWCLPLYSAHTTKHFNSMASSKDNNCHQVKIQPIRDWNVHHIVSQAS